MMSPPGETSESNIHLEGSVEGGQGRSGSGIHRRGIGRGETVGRGTEPTRDRGSGFRKGQKSEDSDGMSRGWGYLP